ncbi:MAG: dTMP kinase [Arhodomonas sp.]|nr:dTMP kinase [Arhodomonas sp.]
MTAKAEALLVFAARAEHLEQVITPALEAGQWGVLGIALTDAVAVPTRGAGRGPRSEARIEALERWVQDGLRPDLTLYLDVPVARGLERAATRSEPDRFESEREGFFERARGVYRRRCAEHPERMRLIDASGEVESGAPAHRGSAGAELRESE